ncbi:hypothetical protein, partial [Segatella oris]|uniref:hypothetical protein n=1 Tax=Segatella oris TaxID=28135 RepID=UPI0036105F1F
FLTYLPRYFADDYPITASTSENEKTQLTPINMVQIYKKQRLETNDLPLKCKLILRHIDCDLCLVISINNCRDTGINTERGSTYRLFLQETTSSKTAISVKIVLNF